MNAHRSLKMFLLPKQIFLRTSIDNTETKILDEKWRKEKRETHKFTDKWRTLFSRLAILSKRAGKRLTSFSNSFGFAAIQYNGFSLLSQFCFEFFSALQWFNNYFVSSRLFISSFPNSRNLSAFFARKKKDRENLKNWLLYNRFGTQFFFTFFFFWKKIV